MATPTQRAMKNRGKVTANGAITPPIEWREEVGVEEGDTVVYEFDDDGALRVVPAE